MLNKEFREDGRGVFDILSFGNKAIALVTV